MRLRILFKDLFSENSNQSAWKSYLIWGCCLVITFLLTWYAKNNLDKQESLEFESSCKEIKNQIASRLNSHAQLLRSGSAFFAASDTVTRKDWNLFYSRINLEKNLAGVQGYGYAIIIPKEKLERHVQKIKKEGFPEYTVKPDYDRNVYTSIIFIEPFANRNLRAFGYDMLSDPVRRKAMETACDHDIATLTDRVKLVQETNEDIQPGILMYVPVFKKQLPCFTIAQRQKALLGWVYSPFRMYDLMNGIINTIENTNQKKIRIRVTENSYTNEALLYDSQTSYSIGRLIHPDYNLRLNIDFNGKIWNLYFSPLQKSPFLLQGRIWIILISGLMISTLLFFLAQSLLSTNIRAQKIANQLTQDLKESELRFKKLFENHKSIMLLIDPETNMIMDANLAASNYYGYSIQKIKTMNMLAICVQPSPEILESLKDLSENRVDFLTLQHHLSTGEIRDVEVHSSIVTFAGKQIYFSIIHDITERNKMALALHLSEKRWKYALEGSGDGIWDWNMQTNEVYFSSQWKKMLGFSDEEIGNNLNDWEKQLHPDDKEKCFEDLQLYIEGKQPTYVNMHRLLCKNGNYKWILARGKIIEYDNFGKPLRMIGTHSDISDRKELEKKLTEINDDKDRFISILAHDLKGPFNSILGLLELLQINLHKYDIKKIETLLNKISDSSRKVYNLLEDILLWIRSETGHLPFEPSKQNLHKTFLEVSEVLNPIAASKNITINYHPSIQTTLNADQEMLKTIIRNLISNAIKFTFPGGQIDLFYEKNDEFSLITISDNGVGISNENCLKLFNISNKLTTSGTLGESGTGLGLLLCHEFVEMHGGKIWVESEPGKGSNFKFTIPLS